MTNPICERTLVARDGQTVKVSINAPVQEDGLFWACSITFQVGGETRIEHVPGTDSFQALQIALFRLWKETRELGYSEPDSPFPDSGIYRPVVMHELTHDTARIHAMIDAEVDKFDDSPEKLKAARDLRRAAPKRRPEEG